MSPYHHHHHHHRRLPSPYRPYPRSRSPTPPMYDSGPIMSWSYGDMFSFRDGGDWDFDERVPLWEPYVPRRTARVREVLPVEKPVERPAVEKLKVKKPVEKAVWKKEAKKNRDEVEADVEVPVMGKGEETETNTEKKTNKKTDKTSLEEETADWVTDSLPVIITSSSGSDSPPSPLTTLPLSALPRLHHALRIMASPASPLPVLHRHSARWSPDGLWLRYDKVSALHKAAPPAGGDIVEVDLVRVEGGFVKRVGGWLRKGEKGEVEIEVGREWMSGGDEQEKKSR